MYLNVFLIILLSKDFVVHFLGKFPRKMIPFVSSLSRDLAVNVAISNDDFFVGYFSCDDAISLVLATGKKAFRVKRGIRHAFGLCPACHDHW